MEEGQYPILVYFSYKHLPEGLQKLSMPFADLAQYIVEMATENPAEVAAGLRKLLEAKDCIVRAGLKA